MERSETAVGYKGYGCFQNAVEPDLVQAARGVLDQEFAHLGGKVNILTPLEVLNLHSVRKIIFDERIYSFLVDILGCELYMINNYTVRRKPATPWHRDQAFLGEPPIDSQYLLQCSVYLQDSPFGGLDVIPRSHIDIPASDREVTFSYIKELTSRALTIPSLAGDLVIWDGLLLHRSSRREHEPMEMSYAIQWTVASDRRIARRFATKLAARAAPGQEKSRPT